MSLTSATKAGTPKKPAKAIFICAEAAHEIGQAYPAAPGVETLLDIIKSADAKLDRMGITATHRPGASLTALSGRKVANAYKYSRPAVKVSMSRKTKGWYITGAEKVRIYPSQGDDYDPRITVTHDQIDEGTHALKKLLRITSVAA